MDPQRSLPSSPSPSSPPPVGSLLLTLPDSMEKQNVFSPRPLPEGERKNLEGKKEEKKEKEQKEKEKKENEKNQENGKDSNQNKEEKEGVEEEVLRSISNELDDRVRCFVWSLLESVNPSLPLTLHTSHPGLFFFANSFPF